MLLPDFPRKKLLTKSFRTTILSIILLCLPIGGHAVKPPACSSIEDPRITYLARGVFVLFAVIDSLHLNVQTVARNLVNALWPDQPSGTETEAATTGESQEPDTDTGQREEAVSWVAGQLGGEEPTNGGAAGSVPPRFVAVAGSEDEDSTDAASGAGLTSSLQVLNNVVNRQLDAFQLANVVSESNPEHQTLVEQMMADVLALSPVVQDQTDNVPAITVEDPDNSLYLRTQPTDNLQLSQLATPGETLQTVLRNSSLYSTQSALIALHAFLLEQYLELRHQDALSPREVEVYRRLITRLVMAIHTISEYNHSETTVQPNRDQLSNWAQNEYVSSIIDSFLQSVRNAARIFTANQLDNGIQLAFGIIQHFRSFIIDRRVSEQALALDSGNQEELDRDAHTVDTVRRLDALADLFGPDSDTLLSSLAYARVNVQPHTNAILERGFWMRGNIIHQGLNNLQRWHILNEIHVALQLVVLGQNELALSVIRKLYETYRLPESDERYPLPAGNNSNYETIIQWVFGMVDALLDFSDGSEPTPETSGNVLRDRFFISVYALVVYTETPSYAQGRSDHQIVRINTDVLDYLYKLLLTPKTSTETEASSESEPASDATLYLDSRYVNFLRTRHEGHKKVLTGNIQEEARRRLEKRSGEQ